MPITSIAGADVIGGLGSALSNIGTGITGINALGFQYVLGLLILLFFAGLLALRGASMELMAAVLFPLTLMLVYFALLPWQVGLIAIIIGMLIVAKALLSILHLT